MIDDHYLGIDIMLRSCQHRSKRSTRRDPEAYALALSEPAPQGLVIKALPSGVRIAIVAERHAPPKKPRVRWTRLRVRRFARPETVDGNRSAKDTGIEPLAYAPNARARALLRGMKIAEADLSEAGGTYELGEVRKLLNGVTRQALDKRVREGSLLAVPGPSNRRRYPTFQFTQEGILPRLKKVQEALPTRNPWAVLNFFVRPDDRLGSRKPIEVLRNGDVDLVISAARGMSTQGG